MTVTSGLGYTLLAIGPAIALFFTVIIQKPILILIVIASAIVWLVVLICISTVWLAFLPSSSDAGVYSLMLISAVGVQGAARPLLWQLYLRLERALQALAVKLSKPGLLLTDKLQIAMAAGLGHGLAHVSLFCLSLLMLSFGPATYYNDSCPEMPFFLVTALIGLGFLLIHTFSMVIAFIGYSDGKRILQLFPPGMHLLAALLTLVNNAPHGCMVGVPLVLICSVITLLFCGKTVWDKTGEVAHRSGDRISATTL